MTINFPKLVMNPKFRGETALFALSHVLVQKKIVKKKINVSISITKQHPHVKVAGRSIASEEFIERGETYCYYLYQPPR